MRRTRACVPAYSSTQYAPLAAPTMPVGCQGAGECMSVSTVPLAHRHGFSARGVNAPHILQVGVEDVALAVEHDAPARVRANRHWQQ